MASDAHGGNAVNIINNKGTDHPTSNTVTVNTGGSTSTVNVNITGVKFKTDGNPAITVDGNGTLDLGMTGVNITVGKVGEDGSQGPAVSVRDSTVNINANGTNSISQISGGSALALNAANVTVTGDSSDDQLNLSSTSQSGTVSGDDSSSTLSVTGEATVEVTNTAGAAPVNGPSVSGTQSHSDAGNTKTTTITSPSGGNSSNNGGESEPVKIPTVEELKAMTPAEVAALSPEVIAALTTKHIAVLTAEQIKALSKEQVAALSPEAIAALTKVHIRALTAGQIRALSTEQIQMLTEFQIRLLTKTQIRGLSQEQLQALSQEQIDTLNERKATS